MIRSVLLAMLCVALSQVAEAKQTDAWTAFIAQAERDHGDLGRQAASFLRDARPARDADIDPAWLTENLDLALRAREEFPWAGDIPEDVFLNDVLPYAIFDETREPWRRDFYQRARRIVQGCETATEAAQALNREFFNEINVHYNTGRKRPNQSPSESIEQGRATCTGLTIILAYACRSVGVPARAAGVASWHDKRGNHTWVEIWDDGWHFTGADEYDANGLNRGWFTNDAAKAVPGDRQFAVWATSWRNTGESFPMVWARDDDSVPGVDVTTRYLPAQAGADDTHTHFLRTWLGDQRVAANVRLVDDAGRLIAEVRTRAGTADLNDMPGVSLESRSCMVEIDHADMTHVGRIDLTDSTIDIDLLDLDLALSRESAERAIEQAWRVDITRIIAEHNARPDATFIVGDHEMPILERTFGDEPEDGHSLWISMHGGGGAPPRVNDQQWRNQIGLYQLEEGIYVAPRAPTNTWNLWHQAHIDPLFDQLIATYVATRNVNPDRVYLLGYSAGGDGVYQLAPRMADRFAAAAMMAGHPNESEPLGLRNLPFALFMGGQDTAYNRNTVAEAYGERLAALQAADPEGYEHWVKIYPQHAHGMKRDEKEALPWMAGFTRTPWPMRVLWDQDDVHQSRFYWLASDSLPTGGIVTAEIDAQTITIQTDDVTTIDLLLSDELLDLDQEITVIANDTVVFQGMARRTLDSITRSLRERRDPRMAATATLTITWD